MKLSVVIAAHNEEALLPAQLAALRSQTFDGDWEVIVADNRSTDATPHLVTELAAEWPRLRLVQLAMQTAHRRVIQPDIHRLAATDSITTRGQVERLSPETFRQHP